MWAGVRMESIPSFHPPSPHPLTHTHLLCLLPLGVFSHSYVLNNRLKYFNASGLARIGPVYPALSIKLFILLLFFSTLAAGG